MKHITIRDIKKSECGWLRSTIKKGTIVYSYNGPTYGCISSGSAFTFKDGETPFFELPDDSVKPMSDGGN